MNYSELAESFQNGMNINKNQNLNQQYYYQFQNNEAIIPDSMPENQKMMIDFKKNEQIQKISEFNFENNNNNNFRLNPINQKSNIIQNKNIENNQGIHKGENIEERKVNIQLNISQDIPLYPPNKAPFYPPHKGYSSLAFPLNQAKESPNISPLNFPFIESKNNHLYPQQDSPFHSVPLNNPNKYSLNQSEETLFYRPKEEQLNLPQNISLNKSEEEPFHQKKEVKSNEPKKEDHFNSFKRKFIKY